MTDPSNQQVVYVSSNVSLTVNHVPSNPSHVYAGFTQSGSFQPSGPSSPPPSAI